MTGLVRAFAPVMSAFSVMAYAVRSVQAVLAGLVVGSLGLEATFAAFGVIIVLIAFVTAVVCLAAGRPFAASLIDRLEEGAECGS